MIHGEGRGAEAKNSNATAITQTKTKRARAEKRATLARETLPSEPRKHLSSLLGTIMESLLSVVIVVPLVSCSETAVLVVVEVLASLDIWHGMRGHW